MTSIPYLGSKINLISKYEIRYEGVLYAIDTKESTVALAKVRLFGTEDRPTSTPVAPRDQVYEYIIFRANDIKDLHVCEAPKTQHGLPHDPAIVQHSSGMPSYSSQPFSTLYGLGHFPHLTSQPTFPLLPSTAHYSGSSRATTPTQRKSPTSDAGVQVSVEHRDASPQRVRQDPKMQYRFQNRNAPQAYSNRWRNNLPTRPPSRRQGMSRRGRGRSPVHQMEVYDGEYDFEQANAEFLELEGKLSKSTLNGSTESSELEDTSGTYDKGKSFFDDISCEASQRSKGLPRFDWRMERKLNVETFGVSANTLWMRRRRGSFRRAPFRPRSEKTVTFSETVSEVEVEIVEKPDNPLPTVEVSAPATDWPEPKQEQQVWS